MIRGIRGSFAVIVNALIIKCKKWKNVGKSYLAIPVVWTTGLMINGFFWSCLLLYAEWFTVNGIKHPRLHQHKVLTRRLRLPVYPKPPHPTNTTTTTLKFSRWLLTKFIFSPSFSLFLFKAMEDIKELCFLHCMMLCSTPVWK